MTDEDDFDKGPIDDPLYYRSEIEGDTPGITGTKEQWQKFLDSLRGDPRTASNDYWIAYSKKRIATFEREEREAKERVARGEPAISFTWASADVMEVLLKDWQQHLKRFEEDPNLPESKEKIASAHEHIEAIEWEQRRRAASGDGAAGVQGDEGQSVDEEKRKETSENPDSKK